ncbi:hypothetical protein RQP46_004114 [Phenoliferia psychrophenolica]
MGTGITSIILHNLPYQFHGLRLIATIIFALNASLFILFLLVTIARYAFYPRIWTSMINHNVQSLFWGTFAMGFATVGDGIVLFCVPAFGGRWVQLAWACWWIDAVLSLVIGIGLPFLMFTRHKNEVSQVTGVWLLPIVAPIVAAAMGGIVSDVLPPDHARLTIIISYMLLGCGLGPALLVQALYFQRLAIYKSPPMATIVSVFLPIGPCGQSAFAFLQLAAALRRVHAIDGKGLGGSATDVTGAIYALSFLAALFMMGMGFFWLVIAIATSLDLARRPGGFPFNMGWWGFTFPLGTMATSAILLAAELDSTAFRAFAMVLSVPVVLFWFQLLGPPPPASSSLSMVAQSSPLLPLMSVCAIFASVLAGSGMHGHLTNADMFSHGLPPLAPSSSCGIIQVSSISTSAILGYVGPVGNDGSGAYTITPEVASSTTLCIPCARPDCVSGAFGISTPSGSFMGVSVNAAQTLSTGSTARSRARALRSRSFQKRALTTDQLAEFVTDWAPSQAAYLAIGEYSSLSSFTCYKACVAYRAAQQTALTAADAAANPLNPTSVAADAAALAISVAANAAAGLDATCNVVASPFLYAYTAAQAQAAAASAHAMALYAANQQISDAAYAIWLATPAAVAIPAVAVPVVGSASAVVIPSLADDASAEIWTINSVTGALSASYPNADGTVLAAVTFFSNGGDLSVTGNLAAYDSVHSSSAEALVRRPSR